MTKLTKERLEEIAELARKATYKPCAMHMTNLLVVCDSEVIEEMARQLLASMEQEPVAWKAGNRAFVTRVVAEMYACEIMTEIQPLYTAPPAPVVPEWTNEQCLEFLSIAFRHAEIKGDLELDDIRLGVKMVNGGSDSMLKGDAK